MSGDWLNNLLCNPSVIVEVNGNKIKGIAAVVEDAVLRKARSEERRVGKECRL